MLSLRTLGALDLTADDGRSLQSVVSQPLCAAVLAYLAASRPYGPQRRDRLLPLFWPESDEASARHSLSDTLYRIRARLGPDVIEATGHSVLRLSEAVVKCDVRAFGKAIVESRWADALDLYRGEFLCGFHLAGAPGFERWMASERERLQEQAADAAWSLATEQLHGGTVTEAERTGQRAVDFGPTDEEKVLAFVEALVDAGDRAAAVHFYERWKEALEAELEIAPAPETAAAVRKLRSDPAPDPGGVEPGAAPPGSAGGDTRVGPDPDPTASPSDAAGGTQEDPVPRPGSRSASGGWSWWRVAGGVAAFSAIAWLALSVPGPRIRAPLLANAVEVSGALAVERAPAWSPDSEALAYESEQHGDWDIWIARPGTGQAVNRTADYEGDDLHPTWSPDGHWIAFFSWREGGGYFLVPAMGGPPRRVAPWPAGEACPTPAEWSPDGTAFAYVLRQNAEPFIEIRTLADGATRRLELPARPRNNTVVGLSWSPNGRFLAYPRAHNLIASTAELWLTNVADGESIQLTDGTVWDGSPSWGRGARALYFVSTRRGGADLWRFEIGESGRPAGTPDQVTTGMELIDAEVAPDGRKLAFTRGRVVSNVYRAPLSAEPVTWADVTQLTFDEAVFESIDARDGRLLLSSDRSGNFDIFEMPAVGGALRPLTMDSALDAGPRWSPDGEDVVFHSTRSGQRQVWILASRGGTPRKLTDGPEENRDPTWSPDGLEIVAPSERGLVALAPANGAERQLTGGLDGHPAHSPDGRWIAFSSARMGESGIWLVPAAGGVPERLARRQGTVPRWSPDGKWIFFLGLAESADTVWALSVDSREERPATALDGRPGRLGLAGLAIDQGYLYFTWQEPRGDIWVADLVSARDR